MFYCKAKIGGIYSCAHDKILVPRPVREQQDAVIDKKNSEFPEFFTNFGKRSDLALIFLSRRRVQNREQYQKEHTRNRE